MATLSASSPAGYDRPQDNAELMQALQHARSLGINTTGHLADVVFRCDAAGLNWIGDRLINAGGRAGWR